MFEKEEVLGDYAVNPVVKFNEKTVKGNKLVLFDNRGTGHATYYVFEFTGNKYIAYTYHYMSTHEEYVNVYQELSSKIVDYNYQEYMIKTLDNIGNGNFLEAKESLSSLIENNELVLVY